MKYNQHIAFSPDPITQFHEWFRLAQDNEINDPNAMALATIGTDGWPQVRIVLLKSYDTNGFCFFTNSNSAKGAALAANPRAALCFHWKTLQRQIRITGPVEKLSATEDDDYFVRRYRISQLGAWASLQSQPLDSMATLETRLGEITQRYENSEVPRPPHWGGYRIVPQAMEFWAERPHRLHERMIYHRVGDDWRQERLYP